jgi:hypothetical protein
LTVRYPNLLKGGGGYHLAGEVEICSNEIFKNLVELVLPLLEVGGECMRVVLPPQPRYLFNGCCRLVSHCTNIGSDGYASKLLGDTVALRALLKKMLLPKLSHKGKFWILDSCAALVDPSGLAIPERLKGLGGVSAYDGVHQTAGGYQTIAANIFSSIRDLSKGTIGKPNLTVQGTSALSVAGGARTFTWHGFHSPIGARIPPALAHAKRSDRERIHRNFSPYARGGQGGGFFKKHRN